MKKTILCALAATTAFVAPQAAFAQDAGAEVTVGAFAGYHDLGVSSEDADVEDFDITDNGGIFGGFIAVDFPVSDNVFVGIEGNGAFGTGAIESEYGASARLGFRTNSGTKFYVRGGYQEVDLDAAGIIGVDESEFDEEDLGIDTSGGDYLVGAGVEVPVGKLSVRVNVDTIAFDTVRATAGLGIRF